MNSPWSLARTSLSLMLGIASTACSSETEPSSVTGTGAAANADTDTDTDTNRATDSADTRAETSASSEQSSCEIELLASRSDVSGFDTATWWFDTGEEVVVFDAQFTPEHAQAVLGDITAATDNPIAFVVAMHPNPDKFNGAAVFQAAGATFVTSESTANALAEVHAYKEAFFVGSGSFEPGAYPALVVPDLTFAGTYTMPLGNGCQVELVELENSGVTRTQTVAVLGAGEVLVVGDLVAGRSHAWLEGGIFEGQARPDLAQWRAALTELEELAPNAEVYPGRGQVLPVSTAVTEQVAYLDGMEQLVAVYISGLEDPMAAFTGPDASDHYAALTSEAQSAFPEHSLSYMVTFGVYGLVFAML